MFLFERQVGISFVISIVAHICLLGFAYNSHVQSCQQTIIITDVELLEPLPLEEEIPPAREKAKVIPFWKAPQQTTINLLKKIKLIPPEPEKEAEKALDVEKPLKIQAPLIKEEEKPIEKPIEIKNELKKKTLTELYEKSGEKLPDIIELPKKKITLEGKATPMITPEKSIRLEEVGEKQIEVKRVVRPGKPMLESFKQIPEEAIHPEQLLGKKVIPLPKMQKEEGMVNLQERQEIKPIGIAEKKKVVVSLPKTFMPSEDKPEEKSEIAIEKKQVKKPAMPKPMVRPEVPEVTEAPKVEKKRVVVVPLQKTFMPSEDKPEEKAEIAIVKKPAMPKPIVKREVSEAIEEPKETQPIEDKLKTLKKEGASKATIIGPLSKRPKIRTLYPEYPAWAEKKGIEAQVVIYFTVTPDGMVNSDAFVELTSGHAQLDQLALQALRGWKFAPLPMDAEQKDQWGRVTFRFILQ